jgi:hypothetical protein
VGRLGEKGSHHVPGSIPSTMVAVHTLNLWSRAASRDSTSQQSASQVEEVKRVPPATDGRAQAVLCSGVVLGGSHSHSHPCSCHEVPHDKNKDRVRVPWPCGRGCAGQACPWWFPHGAKKNADGSDAGCSCTYCVCTKY